MSGREVHSANCPGPRYSCGLNFSDITEPEIPEHAARHNIRKGDARDGKEGTVERWNIWGKYQNDCGAARQGAYSEGRALRQAKMKFGLTYK